MEDRWVIIGFTDDYWLYHSDFWDQLTLEWENQPSPRLSQLSTETQFVLPKPLSQYTLTEKDIVTRTTAATAATAAQEESLDDSESVVRHLSSFTFGKDEMAKPTSPPLMYPDTLRSSAKTRRKVPLKRYNKSFDTKPHRSLNRSNKVSLLHYL